MIAVFLLLLLSASSIILYAMPFIIGGPFAALCLWLLYKRKRAELGMLLGSLLFMLIPIEIYVRMNADDIFWRVNEKWSVHGRFKANVVDTAPMPYGDLVAMMPSLKGRIAEPREIEFRTDSIGFRNDKDYTGERYVLLGDSFIEGVANTHKNMLSSQINAKSMEKVYSLGYPGEPWEYERRAMAFMRKTKAEPRFIWFVFEGNDFKAANSKHTEFEAATRLNEILDRFTVRELPLLAPRFFIMLSKKLTKKRADDAKPTSEVFTLAGKEIGFFSSYLEAASSPDAMFVTLDDENVLARTACVFFIPDKYRVYKPWIHDGRTLPEPAPALSALKNHFAARKIPVIDLTPALRGAASVAMETSEFVYWRDDTHWNAKGIAAAVDPVKKCMEADKNL